MGKKKANKKPPAVAATVKEQEIQKVDDQPEVVAPQPEPEVSSHIARKITKIISRISE